MLKHKIIVLTILILTACDATTEQLASRDQAFTFLEFGWASNILQLSEGNNNNILWEAPSQTKRLVMPHANGSTITGFDNIFHQNGSAFYLRNQSQTQSLTLAANSSLSDTPFQFRPPFNRDVVVGPLETVMLDWDQDLDGWAMFLSPARVGSATPSTPSRSFNTTFQVTQPTLGCYTVRVSGELTLLGSSTGRVELRSDTSNPPTTVRGSLSGGLTGTLAVGLVINDSSEGQVCFMIPAGYNTTLATVITSGSPTFSIIRQVETRL